MSKNVVELNADRDGEQGPERDGSDGKPAILRAVELIISHPSRIKAAAHSLHGNITPGMAKSWMRTTSVTWSPGESFTSTAIWLLAAAERPP